MKHIFALLIKFLFVALILEIVLLPMSRLTFYTVLPVALTVTIISYVLGDLLILPRSNNTLATTMDAILSVVTINMFNLIYPGASIPLLAALIAAIALCVGEWLFHKFMLSMLFQPNKGRR